MKNLLQSDLVKVHLSIFLFGVSSLFAKTIDLPQTTIAFSRALLATITVALWLLVFQKTNKASLKLKRPRDFFLLSLQGVFLSVHLVFFFKAIAVSSVAVGVLAFSAFPIIITFLEPLFFREKLRPFDLAMAILTLVGVFIIIPDLDMNQSVTQGVVFGLIAACGYALTIVLNRCYVQRYSSGTVSFYLYGAATILLAPFLWISPAVPSGQDWGMLLILGVLMTGIAMLLLNQGLKTIKAHLAGIISCLEPVYGIVLAMIIFLEMPSLRTLLGGVIILGVVIGSTLYSGDKK